MKTTLGFAGLVLMLAALLAAVLHGRGEAEPARADIVTLDHAPAAPLPGNRIEVLEFFHFGCRHCRTLEPALAAWRERHGERIAFRRVPVAPAPQLLPYARLLHALVALREEALIPAVFDEIHARRNPLATREQQAAFVAAHGVDPQRFGAALDAPELQQALDDDRRLWEAYAVRAVPMIVVQGRYSPRPGADPDAIVRALDTLLTEAG